MRTSIGCRFSFLLQVILGILGFCLTIYVAEGSLQLVSVRNPSLDPPAGGNGESGLPVISPDGRYVLFASSANNLVLISNSHPMSVLRPPILNVFRRDRTNGTTTLASVNLAGTGSGNGDSLPRGISSDGRYVLFESSAGDLATGDTNNTSDAFVRDMITGTTRLVSVNTNGRSGNGASWNSTITPDGRYVAFVSAATDLTANDTNGIPDVFVRDLQSGTTTLASPGALSTSSYLLPSGSESPAITSDGRCVVFFSSATNLVPQGTNAGEVYVRDLLAGTTTWASTNAHSIYQSLAGTADAMAVNQAISSNGQYVAFEVCSNLISGPSRGILLRYNRQTGLTDIVYTNANVPQGVPWGTVHNLDLTPDGRFIAFVANIGGPGATNTAIYLWDAQTGSNTLVSASLTGAMPDTLCDNPTVDASGRYVAFFSTATNLTADALAGTYHLYVRDVQAGTTRLIDVDTNGIGSGVNPATIPALSADGSSIAFECPDGNLVPDDNNHDNDVFVRDLTTETTGLISAHHPTLPSLSPNGYSVIYSSSVSTNGRYVAFVSDADNLVTNNTNRYRDVFVRDLLTGANLLVSTDTNSFAAGSGMSAEPAISGNGRLIAFSSFADNLVAGDTNKAQDVFVRDLQAGTNALVSVSLNGGFGDNDSYSPSLSADGRYVLFRSLAKNLAPGTFTTGTENLFLHDMIAGTNYALTTGGSSSAAMTPDGRYVAFAGIPPGFGSSTLFVWDTLAGQRIYTNTATFVLGVSISPDGHWLLYTTLSPAQLNAVDLIARTNWVITSLNNVSGRSHAGLQFSRDGRFLAYAVVTNLTSIQNVFLYDLQTGTNLLVSRRFDSSGAPNGTSDSPVISADGRYVAYRSFASNCVPNDLNDLSDVFLYDRLAGTTTLLSASSSVATTANSSSFTPVFSGDGKTLLFQSWASDLLAQDGNDGGDLFALKLAFTDSDGDGMDDQWELAYFGTLDRNGTGDYDGDGISDLNEFLAGTDPTDPASVFRARVIYSGAPGQDPAITWPTAPGKSYRVQFKHDLSDASWQNLNSNVILLGNTACIYDPVPAAGRRFYRVVIVN